jgi:NodT family efflux transporter outer membrane factor (OMF) lipoprotein
MNDTVKTGVVLSAAVLLAGCAVGPNYRPVQMPAPGAWAGSSAAGAPVELSTWWASFNDPKLTALVEEALRSNLDLKLAEARLRQARATRGVIAGGLWPTADAFAGYKRTNVPANPAHDLYQTGLDALWEVDIFGGKRRDVESATANIRAARENLRDVQVSLAAEVALNYVQLRGYQQQIDIAQSNLQAQSRTGDITRQRFDAGFVSSLDVATADAQVATTQAVIPVLQAAAQQSIYSLSVLLGRPPADLLQDLSETEPLPVAPPEVPAGLPSDLLRRRPDIRQAEAELHVATAQIGVATADLFPKFSLTGSVNWQAEKLADLYSGAARSWSVGPSVNWSIFQGGSVVANIQVQKALRDQAFIAYQKTVLAALQDVENALIAYAKEWEHRKSLHDAVVANRKAVTLAMQLYTQGESDFLNVLVAQRSLYASEEAYVQSTRNTATDLIALYKALGGGWELDAASD